MQFTLVRLIQATALRRIANRIGETEQHWMQTIAQRIPSSGMTLPQLQALLEDEMPSFSPSILGANTLKEALQSMPDLLTIDRDSDGKEVVKRCVPGSYSKSSTTMDLSNFFDLQKVYKYCESVHRKNSQNPFIRLDDVLLRTGVKNVNIVDHILDPSQKRLKVKMSLKIKPKRPPRAAIVFVDGDELPAVAVDGMCSALNLIKPECTMHIIRRQASLPLSNVDEISPDEVPTFLTIEKKAHELRLRNPGVLKDIIYMCSAKQYEKYAQHVARLNEFPDADVYVCCPSRIEIVQRKRFIPFHPDTAAPR
ncbi:unnamed protein product [Phytomonas sp. EM1]|nr:unnamed protein product [Phytomonas sp. EM1]|eukprot:CCW64503.1 unnamed protein product [Phytomonas sp. isolate EM1]